MRPRPITKLLGVNSTERAVLAVAALAGQRADLVERARVEQRVDALAHRQLAPGVLALDLLRATHGVGQRLAPMQLVDVVLPGHASPMVTPRSLGAGRDPSISARLADTSAWVKRARKVGAGGSVGPF